MRDNMPTKSPGAFFNTIRASYKISRGHRQCGFASLVIPAINEIDTIPTWRQLQFLQIKPSLPRWHLSEGIII